MYRSRLFLLLLLTVATFSCKDDVEPTPETVSADFSMSTQEVTEGGSVTFTDLSTGTPTKWEWTFEGGTPATSNEKNPVIFYNTPGIYGVSLKASNKGNADEAIKHEVIVVSAKCAGNSSFACATQVTLDASIKGKIAEKGQTNHYKLVLAQAGILEVAINNVATDLTLNWELTNQDKAAVASGRGNQGTKIFVKKLLGAGTYFLALSDYGNNNMSDQEYELMVSLDTDDKHELNNSFNTASPLNLGQTLNGTLRTEEDLDYFVFTTTQAGVVEVQLSNIDPKLKIQAVVYDQDQAELGSSSYSAGGNLVYNILVGPGKHYLLLKGGKYDYKT